MLFAKEPASVEVYNDLNGNVVNLFRVMRDSELFERLHQALALTPYSRGEFIACRKAPPTDDPVERARRFYVLCRQAFGGLTGTSWSFSVTKSCRGMAGRVSAWLGSIELLPEIHARLQCVQIEQQDFRHVVRTYDRPDTLTYLDPPYVPDTRRSGGYAHELTLSDHEDLVQLLLGLQGFGVLSGYRHPVYEPLEAAGWERRDYSVLCNNGLTTRRASSRTRVVKLKQAARVECVWLCPRTAERLAAA